MGWGIWFQDRTTDAWIQAMYWHVMVNKIKTVTHKRTRQNVYHLQIWFLYFLYLVVLQRKQTASCTWWSDQEFLPLKKKKKSRQNHHSNWLDSIYTVHYMWSSPRLCLFCSAWDSLSRVSTTIFSLSRSSISTSFSFSSRFLHKWIAFAFVAKPVSSDLIRIL